MIQTALTTAWLGRPAPLGAGPVHYFARVGSTNDVGRELARGGAAEGTLIIAEEQTLGKGRLGRRWWAPPGSCLLLSLIFHPPLAPAQAQQLTMIAGLACAEAVEAQTGLCPGLKWPNDLVLEDKKLAGILTELETEGEQLVSAVVGVGLNVNVDFRLQADAELQRTAIGLSQVLGAPVDRLSLLNKLLVRLEQRYERLRVGKSPHAEWAARLVTLGRTVRVTTLPLLSWGAGGQQGSRGAGEPRGRGENGSRSSAPMHPCSLAPLLSGSSAQIGSVLEGEAVGVDADGALLLRLPDGHQKRVLAGDVTLRET